MFIKKMYIFPIKYISKSFLQEQTQDLVAVQVCSDEGMRYPL